LLEEDRVVVTTARMGADPAACERGLLLRHPNLGEMRAILRVPHTATAPMPAVLILHGHSETAEQMMDRVGNALVDAGFAVLAPQLRGVCADKNEDAIVKDLLLRGQALVGVHAAEVVAWTRVMRHWQIIDDERIGAVGHSAGASTLNLAVRIDPTIRALVTDTTSTYRERNDDGLLSTTMSPALHPYHRLINEFSSLLIPVLPVPYGQFDHTLVVDFLRAVLHAGTTTRPVESGR
ncbi:acetylxylan esterase, partial [bacterium]|nr:acetylxylan esterase [bacterium]